MLLFLSFSTSTFSQSYFQLYGGNSSNIIPPDQSFMTLAILGDSLNSEIGAKRVYSTSLGFRYGFKPKNGKNIELSYNDLGDNGYKAEEIFEFIQELRSLGIGYRYILSNNFYSRMGVALLSINQKFSDKSENTEYRVSSNPNDEQYTTLSGYFSIGWSMTFYNSLSLFMEVDSTVWHHDSETLTIEKYDTDFSEWEELDQFDPKPLHLTSQFLFGLGYIF